MSLCWLGVNPLLLLLAAAAGCHCSLSEEVEEIEPLNDEDPSVVAASITAVSDIDAGLPFTTLGEGDNKVGL